MVKKTIAIDIDDVLADSTEALRNDVNLMYGLNLTREHYLVEDTYSRYYEKVWERNNVGHLVSFDDLRGQMIADQSHIKPIHNAIQATKKLATSFNLVTVTSRSRAWMPETRRWLNNNFKGVFSDSIFVHHDDGDTRTKGDVCVEIGAEWLIDDNPDHCQSALAKDVKAILFGNYGWSRTTGENRMTRANNWKQVLELFENEA